MRFGEGEIFEVEPVTKPVASVAPSWGKTSTPVIEDEDAKKKLFGIELAKGYQNPFDAACVVFGTDNGKALWASREWVNDPVVIGARDAYKKASEQALKLLSKEETALKVLQFHEAKSPTGLFLADAKTRLDALKLYGEMMGYTGKNAEPPDTSKRNIDIIQIEFVEPERKQARIIDVTPSNIQQSEEPLTDIDIEFVSTGT